MLQLRWGLKAIAALGWCSTLNAVEIPQTKAYDLVPVLSSTFESTPEFQIILQASRDRIAQVCNSSEEVLIMHDRFLQALAQEGMLNPECRDTQRLLDAVQYSAIKHRNQSRKNLARTPYIVHPIGVALILWVEGRVRDPDLLIAALLHDTVEDTETKLEEIEARFGRHVSRLVGEVTDDRSLPQAERKKQQIVHARQLSGEAKLIKLADKLYNLRDLMHGPPVIFGKGGDATPWEQVRVDNYFLFAERVIDGLRGTSSALEAELDLVFEQHRADLLARLPH